ncbi:tetratricopeptide repeat protein [Chryseolinea sp. T2]|uniref:tetratricopeptide repeat protein n=1 Tax=Chryseolinea sp. T2 TaxID=3129255 RepID=UPI003076D0AD
MRILFVLIFMWAFGYKSLAQHVLPDSVASKFENVPHDSVYLQQLNSLASSFLKTDPTASRNIAAYVTEIAQKLKYRRGYARGLTLMGNSYWYEGIYEYAQNYYLLAAREYIALNDSIGISGVYNNIGEVNKRMGENKVALQYLMRSLQYKKNDSTKALTLYNIAELYLNIKEYDSVQSYIDKSLSIAVRSKDERVIAYGEWTLARMLMEQGSFHEAGKYFKSTEKRWTKLGELRSLIQTYQDLAVLSRKTGDLASAEKYLKETLRMSKQLRVPDLRVTTLLEFARIDSTRGDYKGAFRYYTQSVQLKDSVYNLLKSDQIARVQAIFESERHEKENIQLRTETSLKEAQLKSQKILIAAILVGLLIAGIQVYFLVRQRKKILLVNRDLQEKNREIHDQKLAIERQAEDLQQLNDRLQDLNKSLEQRIDERTQQLRLQNQRLADYTFVNAHKLRAPVASILGLISLLEQADQREQEEILRHLKTCSLRLDDTIHKIGRDLESAMVSDHDSPKGPRD